MKVFLDTIGCRLNQAEIERMAAQLRWAGHTIVNTATEAELVIVNTCAVTTEAASDSRQKIRQASRSGAEQLVITGCWATLSPKAASDLPGVSLVVANPEKDHLVAKLLQIREEEFDLEPIARQPLPGAHLRTRAFIKVQDGCDNFCTFCITRLARGAGRSRLVQEVLKDIKAALAGGAKEVVLTGVHLGSWGADFPKTSHLRELVEIILKDTDVPRLRLSSLEPWDLDERFFTLWQNPRLCRHLHLPLQSGSETVLKRMARKTTLLSFSQLVQIARQISPQIAITTDLIVGFPGETEQEFAETLEFVQKMQFAAGHVFTFSSRPGVAAERMPNQVPRPIRKRRSALLRAALADSSEHYRRQFLAKTLDVLWEAGQEEENSGWLLHGLTDNYIKVSASSPLQRWNRLDHVQIEKITPDGASGLILPD